MKRFFAFLWETLKMAALAFLIVFPIRYFVFQPFVVSGNSMHPNFEDRDYLLIDELSFRFREPERGEVIVFRAPLQPSNRYIKRIIGLPGETIKISAGRVYVIGQEGISFLLDENEYLSNDLATSGEVEARLKEGEYYVLGDNRTFSSDSRSWGALPRQNIIGRAFFRALPINASRLIRRPGYDLLSSTQFLTLNTLFIFRNMNLYSLFHGREKEDTKIKQTFVFCPLPNTSYLSPNT